MLELKHSLRAFRQNPGFTPAAVAALALGIGANTAIFSVVNTVLLKPLPAPEPDRVVTLVSTNRTGVSAVASDIKFNLWREQTKIFQDVSGYYPFSFNLTHVEQPRKVIAMCVTADYFHLFGLPIAQGRAFTAEEELPHGSHAVIVSSAFWKTAFQSDPHLIGKLISLSGDPYEVVGIMADGVRTETPEPPEVWTPFPIDPNSHNQVHYFQAAGRLKPGVSYEAANAQLQLTTQEFRRRYPASLSTSRGDVLSVEPLQGFLVKDVRSSLLIMAAAVSLVLLIACANVANLLLVKAAGRRREIAIRVAIGASRSRIVRQLLVESLLLSVAGAVCGLALGSAGIRALLALYPAGLPRIGLHGANVNIDWRVLAFTALVALVTGVVFGLLPALQASRTDLNAHLKDSSGRTSTGRRQNKIRSLLVVSEMSLALLLLIGAALLIRTLSALRSVNPGFDPHHVAASQITLDPLFAKTTGVDHIVQDAFRRLNVLPGVESVASTKLLPLEGNFNSMTVTIVGRPLLGQSHGNSRWMTISPRYFDVLKIPVLRGRAFTDADRLNAPPVAIINEAMARQFWPSGDPLNERLILGKGLGQNFDEPARQVIGIVGDVHDEALDVNPPAAVFVPLAQRPDGRSAGNATWIVVRARAQFGPLNTAIQNELRQATGLAVPPLRTMDEIMLRSTARQEFNMLLMSIFGGSALLLAAIGIYGLMSYAVQQRTQEMGIRMALGANPGDVRNMVVSQGMRLALLGIAIGVIAAFGLTRFIAGFLFEVKAWDPLVFTLIPVLLAAVALLAVWLPALRATRINPIDALRSE